MGKRGLSSTLMAMAGLALLGAAPLVEAGQWVVITAEQTSVQPGALLDGGKPLKLAEGAKLTLLAEDGKTLTLTGPYSGAPGDGTPAGAPTGNLTAIASLLQGHQQSTSTLGVMRSGNSRVPATADLISVDSSGERCLSHDPVILWRSNTTQTEQIALVDAKGVSLASFAWPAGEAQLPVPARYFEDGKSYLVQRSDKPISLQVHKAATMPNNPAALAAWMATNGCKAQALIVLGGL